MDTQQTQIKEEWRPVVGYEGIYEVSNTGCIRRVNYKNTGTSRILVGGIDRGGYKCVSLSKNGVSKFALLHRVVAMAFIPNPNNLPQVNHKDENKINNCVENLEWCDNKYNVNYGTGKTRRVEKRMTPVIQYTAEHLFVKRYSSIKEASELTGYRANNIQNCCAGKQDSTNGFLFEYEDAFKKREAYTKRKKRELRRDEARDKLTSVVSERILQFDKKGVFLKEFSSISEASRTIGITKRALISALSGRTNTSGGYIWKYCDTNKSTISEQRKIVRDNNKSQNRINAYIHRKSRVSKFTIDGVYIEDYKDAKSAALDMGVTTSAIIKNCEGILKTCKGYVFKYN